MPPLLKMRTGKNVQRGENAKHMKASAPPSTKQHSFCFSFLVASFFPSSLQSLGLWSNVPAYWSGTKALFTQHPRQSCRSLEFMDPRQNRTTSGNAQAEECDYFTNEYSSKGKKQKFSGDRSLFNQNGPRMAGGGKGEGFRYFTISPFI